jgi:Lrp/AsnC family transcriptional regulator, leucine-responsive regulatory protein
MNNLLNNSGFDEIDRAILEELQVNGRVSNADLARKVFLSAPAVHNRIKRLERGDIIMRYVALLNREHVGYDLLCFVYASMENHTADSWQTFRQAIADIPQILECYQQTGDFDVVMKVVAQTRDDLNHIIHEQIMKIPGVCRVKTNMVIGEIKASTKLVLK